MSQRKQDLTKAMRNYSLYFLGNFISIMFSSFYPVQKDVFDNWNIRFNIMILYRKKYFYITNVLFFKRSNHQSSTTHHLMLWMHLKSTVFSVQLFLGEASWWWLEIHYIWLWPESGPFSRYVFLLCVSETVVSLFGLTSESVARVFMRFPLPLSWFCHGVS